MSAALNSYQLIKITSPILQSCCQRRRQLDLDWQEKDEQYFLQQLDQLRHALTLQGHSSDEINYIEFYLCAFMDEAIAQHRTSGDATLVWQRFQSANSGELFYQKLQASLTQPSIHLASLYLAFCLLSLGYRGQYHQTHSASRESLCAQLLKCLQHHQLEDMTALYPSMHHALADNTESWRTWLYSNRVGLGVIVASSVLTMIFSYLMSMAHLSHLQQWVKEMMHVVVF